MKTVNQNLILKFKSFFEGAYDNQHLIKNECHAMGRVLCNIKQVLTGM